ncbi:hypothetical protein LWI29_022941 [Acer saccharum]|uniref:BHLH domain-containing protein n=1 Tax=Acer saccharum TaxID=4024 RepID=A0AA39VE46_ACESA|nr:hypothetical protein LWI29_022941 [Acer saccharum]
MESANLHHHHQHQLQDQLVVSSSSLATPSSYGVASSAHAWTPTPNVTLNAGNFNPNYNGILLNSRHEKNEILVHPHPHNSSMIQQEPPSIHWISNGGSFTSQSSHDMHLSKIKEELSSSQESFPKFTEMLNSSPSSSTIEDSSHHLSHSSYLKNEQKDHMSDMSEKLLFKTISSGFPLNNGSNHQFPAGDHHFYSNNLSSFGSHANIPSRGNFSQIYPSINISNLNNQSSNSPANNSSACFDMNLQALDLLTSPRFSGNFSQTSHDHHHHNLGIYKESQLPFGLDHDHLQQSSRRQSCSNISKASPFNNIDQIATEAKRPSDLIEPKPAQLSAPKKSRLESSCPPFKVRKEKLGDRIASLQQLVAPFGKTDTASVLMEAIGYIKFLQNQVETLSVPYMKASRNKASTRPTQSGLMVPEDKNDESKRGLRSRGLCLVPLSCMSYVTNDGGGAGGIWPPPPNFGGGT